MTVHTLSTPPSSPQFALCVGISNADDVIILMGDAVYSAVKNSSGSRLIKSSPCEIYALADDCKLAGVSGRILSKVRLISYDFFVELTENHRTQTSWD